MTTQSRTSWGSEMRRETRALCERLYPGHTLVVRRKGAARRVARIAPGGLVAEILGDAYDMEAAWERACVGLYWRAVQASRAASNGGR